MFESSLQEVGTKKFPTRKNILVLVAILVAGVFLGSLTMGIDIRKGLRLMWLLVSGWAFLNAILLKQRKVLPGRLWGRSPLGQLLLGLGFLGMGHRVLLESGSPDWVHVSLASIGLAFLLAGLFIEFRRRND